MVSEVVSTLTEGIYATFERRLSIQSLLTITLLFLLVSVSAFRLSIEMKALIDFPPTPHYLLAIL